jgi:hypothetical protein
LRKFLPFVLGVVGLATFFLVAYPFLAKAKSGSVKMTPAQESAYEAQLKRLDGARAAWKDGRLAEAEATYRSVEKMLGDDFTKLELAKLLKDEGKLKEAKDLFGYVMHPNGRHGSTSATNYIELKSYAELCKKVGDSTEAKWALAKANELIAANQRQREARERTALPTDH